MNEFNPILDALNDIDTRYIVEPKRVKHIKTIKYVSAAAVACLVFSSAAVAVAAPPTGFIFRVITPAETPGVNIQIDHHNDHQFSYNITDRKNLNILSKDELLKMGAEIDDEDSIYFACFEDALPSDILKPYNAEPITLGNDNFIEQPCKIFVNSLGCYYDQCDQLEFDYNLTHKKSGIVLRFSCIVSINDFDPIVTHETNETFDKEIIPLNDGSMCLILEQHMEDHSYSTADFSYDGIIYRIRNMSHNMNKEQVKEVLSDLGVL